MTELDRANGTCGHPLGSYRPAIIKWKLMLVKEMFKPTLGSVRTRKLNYTLKRSIRANLVKRCHACDLLRDTAVCEDCRPNGGACVITAPDIYSKSPSPPHLTLLNLAIALALPFPRMSSLGDSKCIHQPAVCLITRPRQRRYEMTPLSRMTPRQRRIVHDVD